MIMDINDRISSHVNDDGSHDGDDDDDDDVSNYRCTHIKVLSKLKNKIEIVFT